MKKNMQYLRGLKGLTQKQLADALFVSDKMVYREACNTIYITQKRRKRNVDMGAKRKRYRYLMPYSEKERSVN